MIVLKVKFILGSEIFVDLGKPCSQFFCVASFINSRLPFSSIIEIISLLCLCLNENLRSAPKLTEAMALLPSIDFSSSLCHPTPTLPSCYKFNKQELNFVLDRYSTNCLSFVSSLVHGNAFFSIFE